MSLPQYPDRQPLTPVKSSVDAVVRLPGSKSITNRALLLAALADGVSSLRAPLHSEDTLYMREALRDLGVTIDEHPADSLIIGGGGAGVSDLTVHGLGGRFTCPAKPRVFIGNSGTTVRFLTAAACLMPDGADIVLDGVPRMRERPISDLLGAMIALGARVESVNGHGCPPVRINGGGLEGGACAMRGDVSSQFLTALLQVAPYARQDITIDIVGDLVSKPYVDITQAVMRSFGADFENDGYRTLRIKAGQRYRGIDYDVEADASNASYFLAAAAVTGGRVRLSNLGASSIQGDVKFIDVLERMGCRVTRGECLEIQGPPTLRAVDVDMEAIPDTAQTLAVLCAFADGVSHVTGLSSLRVKETDRIAAVTNELRKLGVRVDEGRDSWTIHPLADSYRGMGVPARPSATGAPSDRGMGVPARPSGPTPSPFQGEGRGEVSIDTYQDHRMAMSFAVAGLRLPGIVINDPGCVAKTFPDFWQRWEEAFHRV